MERIVGNILSSAQWASDVFDGGPAWERAVIVIKECLAVDWVIKEEDSQLIWVADSLTVSAEYRSAHPYPQFSITIHVLAEFASDEDGYFLASSLNHEAVGGSFIYRPETKSLDFVLYCAVATWSDFALFLLAARAAIGQCENLSRREDTLHFAKCRSAARPHPQNRTRTDHHETFNDRLEDLYAIDFIGGIWLSEREREGVFERINDECNWVEIRPGWTDQESNRTTEAMDFSYQVWVDSEHSVVLNDLSAFSFTEFNSWTEFGRSVVIYVSLPLFTWEGIFDDGASHDEAVQLANLLNIAAHEMCWQKLGLGAWFAKGSQICFSMAIPHTNLKHVVMGSPRFEVADAVFDIINPNMVRRLVNIATRDLHQLGIVSRREPQEMDSIRSIVQLRQRKFPVRASNKSVSANGTPDSVWEFPSTPLLIFGIFNPVGSSLGSLELVHTPRSILVVNRFRHPFSPSETVLGEVPNTTKEIVSTIREAIGGLHERTSIPDFISIPSDVGHEVRDAVIEGLLQMCAGFTEEGVDLATKARRIYHEPNPWWRPVDPDSESTPDTPELDELDPASAYLSTVLNPGLVDYNLGLFQAWWEGAVAFLRDPNDPGEATKTVDILTQHTLDRIHGPHDASE